jgi:hypothetical protein
MSDFFKFKPKDPLSISPKFPKTEFGGEKSRFSPPFSLFENEGDTEEVKILSEMTSPGKNALF